MGEWLKNLFSSSSDDSSSTSETLSNSYSGLANTLAPVNIASVPSLDLSTPQSYLDQVSQMKPLNVTNVNPSDYTTYSGLGNVVDDSDSSSGTDNSGFNLSAMLPYVGMAGNLLLGSKKLSLAQHNFNELMGLNKAGLNASIAAWKARQGSAANLAPSVAGIEGVNVAKGSGGLTQTQAHNNVVAATNIGPTPYKG